MFNDAGQRVKDCSLATAEIQLVTPIQGWFKGWFEASTGSKPRSEMRQQECGPCKSDQS